jgi:hypothetical protein
LLRLQGRESCGLQLGLAQVRRMSFIRINVIDAIAQEVKR